MFGIGFAELIVIFVIALIVVGPERLPKVARTFGHLWGRAQRYFNDIKVGVSREMAIDEISQFRHSLQQETDSAERAMMQARQAIDQEVLQINSSASQSDKTNVQPISK